MKRTLRWAAVLALLLLPAKGSSAGEESTLQGRVTVETSAGQPKAEGSSVVVYIEKVDQKPSTAPPRAEMRQQDKQFLPEVLPVVVGTEVSFPNKDNIYHNVFSRSKSQPFDLGSIQQDSSPSLRFEEPGLVKVYCKIHAYMVGYILVLENSFFALTDPQGSYKISGIPPGEYTVKAWQKFGPEESATVKLARGQTLDLDLRLKEEKSVLPRP